MCTEPDFSVADIRRYARRNPWASPYDLKLLKGVIRTYAYGIIGRYGDANPCKESVRKTWNFFTAGWARLYTAIPVDICSSVTNVRLPFVRNTIDVNQLLVH